MRPVLLPLLFAAASAGAAAPLHIVTELAPPASMLGPDGVMGHETDKIRAIMVRTATAYRIELLPWKRAYLMALQQPHTCVYSTTRTAERESLFKWVGPTDEAEWSLWGRADHEFPLKTLEDARPLRIGTYLGDARDEYLRSHGFNVDPVSNDRVNPQKILLNRIDLWAVGMRNAKAIAAQSDWEGKVVPLLVFNRVKVYLACNRSVPDQLIVQLNAAMAAMRRDGSAARLERTYEHWPLLK